MKTHRVVVSEPMSPENRAGFSRHLGRFVDGTYMIVVGDDGLVHGLLETHEGEVFSWFVGYDYDEWTESYSCDFKPQSCGHREQAVGCPSATGHRCVL